MLRFATLNACGANTVEKWDAIFRQMQAGNYDVLAIQETHSQRFERRDYPPPPPAGDAPRPPPLYTLVIFPGLRPKDANRNHNWSAGVGFCYRSNLNVDVAMLAEEECPGRLALLTVKRAGARPLRIVTAYAPLIGRWDGRPERQALFDAIVKVNPHVAMGDWNIDPECPLAHYPCTDKQAYEGMVASLKMLRRHESAQTD